MYIKVEQLKPLSKTDDIKVLQIVPNQFCPYECYFCSMTKCPDARDMSLKEVTDNINYFMEHYNINEVVLSGGEITCREDFQKIIDFVASKNFDFVTILSNGQNWNEHLAEFCSGKIDRVVLAFTPGQDKSIYNSFRTVELLQKYNIKVNTNTVILKGTCELLPIVASQVKQLEIPNPSFVFLYPTGMARRRINDIVPSWDEVHNPLFKAIDIVIDQQPRINNIPRCYLNGYQHLAKETSKRRLVYYARQFEEHSVVSTCVDATYTEECVNCAMLSKCDGFWKEYLEMDGFPQLGG